MGGGGGGVRGQLPPGPVELDKLSLWMGSSSLETVKSVILIVVTCNCLPFLWPRNWLVHGVCNSNSEEKEATPPPFEIGVDIGFV